MTKKMASYNKTKMKKKFMLILYPHNLQSIKKLGETMKKEVIPFVLLFKLKNLMF